MTHYGTPAAAFAAGVLFATVFWKTASLQFQVSLARRVLVRVFKLLASSGRSKRDDLWG